MTAGSSRPLTMTRSVVEPTGITAPSTSAQSPQAALGVGVAGAAASGGSAGADVHPVRTSRPEAHNETTAVRRPRSREFIRFLYQLLRTQPGAGQGCVPRCDLLLDGLRGRRGGG